jgi:putative endonuclease
MQGHKPYLYGFRVATVIQYIYMYYVYLLRSKKDGKIYTGFTKDLKRRMYEHLNGKTQTTRRMGDIYLLYYEAFGNEQDAQEREKYLKTTQGKRTVKIMLKHSLAPIV